MSESPIEVRLLIDPGPDPMSGTVGTADGDVRPFRGWIELATELESARQHDDAPADDPPS